MKIPKHIRKKCDQRAKYAYRIQELDSEIAEFIFSKGLDTTDLFKPPYEINSIALLIEPSVLRDYQLKVLENYE